MDDSHEEDQPKQNPLEQILSAFLGPEAGAQAAEQMQSQGFDLSAMAGGLNFSPGVFQQLSYMFNADTGPINWRMAEDIAKQEAFRSGDPRLSAAEAERIKQALAAADLWLDPVTDFTTPNVKREAWTRVEWVDRTLGYWKKICEPVAANVSRAMTEALSGQLQNEDLGLPPEMTALSGSIAQAIPRMSAMMFGGQVGNALAGISKESFGSSDSGLPLSDPSTMALVAANVDAFCSDLDLPADEVTQFLAVRECAHSRLFSSVPWLASSVSQAVQAYSSEIAIDMEAIEETARSINPSDPESFQTALTGDIFGAPPTEDQERALTRIQTLLALIEGWVEVVTMEAVRPYLPHADQLREMIRRRRVSGSAGEQLLAQLVGLNLRPRAARDAAKLFTLVQQAQGSEVRDGLWAHPDQAPTAEELSDPENFLAHRESAAGTGAPDEFDVALEQLLEGTLGWADGLEPKGDRPEDTTPEEGNNTA